MSKVAQNSPVNRRLGMNSSLMEGSSSPFLKARSKFVFGSPVMHHSPRDSPFYVRNNVPSPAATPKIKDEPVEIEDKAPPSPVVRWVLQQPRPWSSTSSNDEELATPFGTTSRDQDSWDDEHILETICSSSDVSEKCYSMTYQEESAVTLDSEDEDLMDTTNSDVLQQDDELLVTKQVVISFGEKTKEKFADDWKPTPDDMDNVVVGHGELLAPKQDVISLRGEESSQGKFADEKNSSSDHMDTDDNVIEPGELLVSKQPISLEKEESCVTITQGRFVANERKRSSNQPSSKYQLMTWCDTEMALTLKRLALAVSGYLSPTTLPLVAHPLEMIQFKVHAPRYTSDVTPIIASKGSSPSPILAEMVSQITKFPHSHVKITLPSGEKLQIITQDAWAANIDKTDGLLERTAGRFHNLKENKLTTTEHPQICSMCRTLKEELERQNEEFRRQIQLTERELDDIRERLSADSRQMEVLETTLKEEREIHSDLSLQFEKLKKGMRPWTRISSTPNERKRSGNTSLHLFDIKSKVIKKARPSFPNALNGSGSAGHAFRKAALMAQKEIPERFSIELMKNHPDTNVRKLYQALKSINEVKERLEEDLRDTKIQLANSKSQQQRAMESELIQLREKNQLLTESYQAEKVARKRFFSMLEDAKGKIRVYCRVRPLLPKECSNILDCIDDFTVALNGVRGRQEFQFDHVFTSKHTQEDVFSIAKDMVNLAYDGYNVCIFGYGQTGSGKTYTLLGDPHGKNPGIASRAYLKLFDLIGENESTQDTVVQVSAMELYNEKLLDLLHPQGVPEEKLEIRKESNGMVNVVGCKSKQVDKPSSLLSIFYEACARRHVAATKMNSRSSRSHLIITLLVESTNKLSGTITRGKFSLVDLAGSERQSKSDTVSTQLKEANSINKSLSALGDVIAALASDQPHVPYRNNKLTQLMQDSLGGNAKTLMFVNVSPAQFNLEETTSSLHYAARVKQIKNDPSKITESKEIARLKSVIVRLRKGENVNEA